MTFITKTLFAFSLLVIHFTHQPLQAQEMPVKYPTLELFTNTPCPICGNQNPGLFNRLANYEGQYHLISFYPGKPYNTCIFYNANKPENTARWQYYEGDIFGTPTVAINGMDFKSSNGVTNVVLDGLTGGTSWLEVEIDETGSSSRTVDIKLEDHVGGSVTTAKLFAVIVEREIQYSAPNGEMVHHNVFRKFLTPADGLEVDLSSGIATATYEYDVDASWQAEEVYVIAWVVNPETKEIYNSGTKFDPDFVSANEDIADGVLSIFPNPTSGEFRIVVPFNNESVQVEVYNPLGVKMFAEEFPAGADIFINGAGWAKGNYIVKLNSGERQYQKQITVVN